MNVLVPKLSGFCPGVKAAEKRIFAELDTHSEDSHSVLGMMINNRKYIEYLTKHNVETIDVPEKLKQGSTVFIRTHGIDSRLQEKLSADFNLVDLTCRNVKRVQMIIKEHSDKGEMIFITGKKSHPEVIGLQSYGKNTIIFETFEELEAFIKKPVINGSDFKPENYTGLFITSQTTGSRKLFMETIEGIKSRWPDAASDNFNSICPVTEKKEQEALTLQSNADISFVIGDPLSSNAGKLFQILKTNDSRTWFIQDKEGLLDLNLNLKNADTALVVSSASTPDFVEKAVTDYLKAI